MRLGLLLAALSLSGCMMTRYLAQAAEGQVAILRARRPIDEVVKDPGTPPYLKRLLSEVASVKAFGERRGLRATSNYDTYVDLKRPAVVWVVSACEELSFSPKKWTFPLVGSVPYLGWFDKSDAEHHAGELRLEGWESDVRTASAFSTLGWFDDPVLSTMIHDGPEALGELADVVIHESTHATHYVDGQTAFNESIANFVGDRLAVVWLAERLGADAAEKRAFLESEQDRKRRSALMHDAYAKLDALYKSSEPALVKKAQKSMILSRLRNELGARRPINNATLFEFKSYHGGEEELARLLIACGGDFTRFIQSLKRITKDSFSEPQQRELRPVIAPLVNAGCPG